MLLVDDALIEGVELAHVRGDDAWTVVDDHSVFGFAHLHGPGDELPRHGVAVAVDAHETFGVDDALVNAIDLWHVVARLHHETPASDDEVGGSMFGRPDEFGAANAWIGWYGESVVASSVPTASSFPGRDRSRYLRVAPRWDDGDGNSPPTQAARHRAGPGSGRERQRMLM